MLSRALAGCLLALSVLGLPSCGGNSGGNGSSGPPPPPPTFSLSLNPAQIDLSQGFTQSVQVQAVPENGFSAAITVTATGLPSGVTVSPSTLSLTVGNSGTLVFSASSSATSGSAQVSIAGVSGALNGSAPLALTVIQMTPPIAVPFTTTGGDTIKAFYDESRQLLFATNLGLNEVDVLSGSNLTVQARIPIGQPFGIDQMPDGNTLVVGTATQGFYTINEDTLAVTHYLAPNLSEEQSTMILLVPVAMANGKVLFLGKDIGVGGADIYIYGGQAIIEWDPTSGQFTVPYYVPSMVLEIDNLKRSADHNWAIFAADKLYIYSSATDGFVSSINPINNAPFGVRNVAANPKGSQFAVASAYSVSFYDGAFNLLGTASIETSGLLFQNSNALYSSDGSLLYWELGSAGSVVDVLNTSSFTEVGHIISDFGAETQFPADLMWVGNAQQAFLAADAGVGLLDCSSPHADALDWGGGSANPFAIPLNQSVAVTINGGVPGTTVTFGGQVAPVVSNLQGNFMVQVPASQVAGPVNLVFTQPDGETSSKPQYFDYGVDVAGPTSTMVPPIGNPVMGLFGYGMLNGPDAVPVVSIGGQTISNVAVNTQENFILQELFLQLPNGSPGPADITVNGINGTGTVKAAVTYIPSATIIPTSNNLVQLLYDTHRSLLYALQRTEIQVLNPTTLTWQAPLLPSGTGGFGYVSMALTPDGSQLVVLDSIANTLTVFDPDNPSQSVKTSLTLSAGATWGNVVTTSTGKAFIASLNGATIEFDLATNTYSTTNIFSGSPSRLVATADGKHVAGVNQNSGSGTLATWSSGGGKAAQSLANDIVWVDVAVSADGSLFAALEGDTGAAGVAAALFDGGLHFTNATIYPDLAPPDQPFAMGTIFSPSGLTLLTPLADSIDFFSTQKGTLQGRLLMPELSPIGDLTSGVIALDPNQETIYAISASGLTVATLPSVVDQVTPFPWRYVTKPDHSVPLSAGVRPRTMHPAHR